MSIAIMQGHSMDRTSKFCCHYFVQFFSCIEFYIAQLFVDNDSTRVLSQKISRYLLVFRVIEGHQLLGQFYIRAYIVQHIKIIIHGHHSNIFQWTLKKLFKYVCQLRIAFCSYTLRCVNPMQLDLVEAFRGHPFS